MSTIYGTSITTRKSRYLGTRMSQLFRAAARLRNTVPDDWSKDVDVYRGAWKPQWRQARGGAENGLPWTTDRDVARAFAELPLFDIEQARHAGHSFQLNTKAYGCLATAIVILGFAGR